ncbi:AraC family transcriptional regulator [Methylovirgula sp. 4M-Z18]|uniref:AraC family transcriptional regulator n=1 Tax=Methylovirgula sp. 4M-Z18 TaxID=2293567 RepID=UPI0018F2EE3A|nr:AraC family transcriptional regulator [Methylovirgula sp. 4M-Z18]
MRIETSSMSFTVPPTAALFLRANESHSVTMDGPVALRELFLREDAVARAALKSAVIAVSPLLRELILAACAEPVNWELGGRGHHLTELVLDEISRATPLPLSLPLPRDPRLMRVVAALRLHPSDGRGLDELAHMAGASTRTLARLFRSETGLGFRQWRQQMRMTEALNALINGAPPTRAAALAGFVGQPAFGAAFRKIFGLTPGQARTLGKSLAKSISAEETLQFDSKG